MIAFRWQKAGVNMDNLPPSKRSCPTFTDVVILKLKVHKTNAKIKDFFFISASFKINPNNNY